MKIKMLETVEDLDSYTGDEYDQAVALADQLGCKRKLTEPVKGVKIIEFRPKLYRGKTYDVPNSLGERLIGYQKAERVE